MSIRLRSLAHKLPTPSMVVDMQLLKHILADLRHLQSASGALALFPPKASSIPFVLKEIAGCVHGFSCSSLNELKLLKKLVPDLDLHFTAPGLRPDHVGEIDQLSQYLTFNSLSQWERFGPHIGADTNVGIRINPRLSFVRDERIDPCREYSKLGVPIELMASTFQMSAERFKRLKGLHFHTNCESTDLSALLTTARHVEHQLADILKSIQWINLGGGYLFSECEDLDPFHEAVNLFQTRYNLTVFIEPGASVVRAASYLVATVIDKFVSDAKEIVVLDTSVNHVPEVLEYDYSPVVQGTNAWGSYEYVLAGCTCLAGDVFGHYAFSSPLEIGAKIVFEEVGAYSLVRAHRFNGVELPTICSLSEEGKLTTLKRDTFEDFAQFYGVSDRERVPEVV